MDSDGDRFLGFGADVQRGRSGWQALTLMWRSTFKSSNTRHVVCGQNFSLSVDGSLISEKGIQTEIRLEWSHSDTRVWVAYACTPEEVQQHFETYRTVNRVTMLTDKCGQPKGFAYVEFPEAEAVQEALALNESELHGRPLKVLPKKTNVPGYKQFRSGRNNPYMSLPLQGPLCTLILLFAHGYGNVPRFRRPAGYMPYC